MSIVCAWCYKAMQEFLLPLPFGLPAFLAAKPAGLLNLTCFLQREKVLLDFFMEALIALLTCQE